MAIVVRAKKNQSAGDVIRAFKKKSAEANIIDQVRDRRYFIKPSQIKAVKVSQVSRLRKRMRSLKRMKNISPNVIKRMTDRINGIA
jgi:ribosomal protein S21